MKVTIDIPNCRECPFSSGGDTKHPHESWVCDKLQDNIGVGDTVDERCPLRAVSGYDITKTDYDLMKK